MIALKEMPKIVTEGWDVPLDASVRYHYFRRGKSLCGKFLKDRLRGQPEMPQENYCCRECLKRKRKEP